MPLRFVLAKDRSGKFSFSVMSRNGQVLARSDPYSSRAGAQGAIRSIKSQAADAEVEDHSTKAWADAEAGRLAAAAPKAAPVRRARKAPRPKLVEAEPEPVEAYEAAAPPEPEPEPEETPEPAAESPAAFAEPTATEEGPARRLVSMRGTQAAPDGRTPLRVSLRKPS